MNKKLLLVSFVITGILVGAATVLRQSKDRSAGAKTYSQQELASANGKDGRDCWLAVDGVIYEIDQGYKWLEGKHTESSLAYCGADMSSVIDQAPHGRTKLSQLKKIGSLQH